MLKHMKQIVAKLMIDESGAETMEYALIMGLLIVGCIAVISQVGTKALARWTSLNSSI